MSPRRPRIAPAVLVAAAVAVLALGWGVGAATGGPSFDLGAAGESMTSARLEGPAAASSAQERIDSRSERLAKSRWIPLAVAAALVAVIEAVRRRHRHRGDLVIRLFQRPSAALGRAPPLLVTAN